ncbi:MAG: pyridoxamine 5'-phosphate oxidase family protein [Bacteroidales bacterium]|nr:pyridoxamine 5'-phosphate oxidase family protein [Bacteroidales bacterium]
MKNRPITLREEMERIIGKCEVCHLSMSDSDGRPYVLPLNFGYRDGIVFFHCAPTGKKIDILLANPDVCIAFSTDYELRWQHEEVACSYSMKYRSVLIHGKAEFIKDLAQKEDAMNIIMQHYTGRSFPYNEPALRNVTVFRVVAGIMEGRAYGY